MFVNAFCFLMSCREKKKNDEKRHKMVPLLPLPPLLHDPHDLFLRS